MRELVYLFENGSFGTGLISDAIIRTDGLIPAHSFATSRLFTVFLLKFRRFGENYGKCDLFS